MEDAAVRGSISGLNQKILLHIISPPLLSFFLHFEGLYVLTLPSAATETAIGFLRASRILISFLPNTVCVPAAPSPCYSQE